MRLIDEILSKENLNQAYKRVVSNKGSAGIDGVNVLKLKDHLKINGGQIRKSITERTYKPSPVKRVYIPKGKDSKRPLGIPTATDRVIQQAISQKLSAIYEPIFSNSSYGFRPNRSAHMAIDKVVGYLNDGYEWVIDLDIEKFFDTVNHDKLIQVLRLEVNDSTTLNLFVRSEKAADRVIKSVVSWLERKLFLKVNATKTRITRPTKSKFLGFTFYKTSDKWKPKPHNESKKNLKRKVNKILCRRRAAALPLAVTFEKLNQVIRGWINYFRIGSMKIFIKEFGAWMRHKVRVIILKQWKKAPTIIRNLTRLNTLFKNGFNEESIYKVAHSGYGPYKRASMNVCNFVLSPRVLEMPNPKENRQGLINPYAYYLKSI